MSEWITGYFAGLNENLAVFLVSMLPVVELRGAMLVSAWIGAQYIL